MTVFRRVLLSLAALALILAAQACSKKPDPVSGLLPAEADQLMQLTASMAAADSGGWMAEILASWNATPTVAGRSPFFSATGDSSFTRGSVNWSFNFTYFDTTEAPSEVFTDATEYLELLTTAVGRIPIAPFGGATGTGFYGHVSDTILVTGFADDTLYSYRGIATTDSALVTVSASDGAHFYFVDNVVAYDANFLPGAAFPSSGEVEITAFVEVLNTFNHNDRSGYFDVTILISFDGTQTPTATITLSADAVTTVYRYRIDLRTGAMVRV